MHDHETPDPWYGSDRLPTDGQQRARPADERGRRGGAREFDDPDDSAPRRRRQPYRSGGGTAALVLGLVALLLGGAGLALSCLPSVRWAILAGAALGLLLGIVGTVLGIVQKGASPILPGIGTAVSFLTLVVAAVLLLLVGVGPAGVGPRAEPPPGVAVPNWGQVFDPDGDCTVTPQGPALNLDVPATSHDLSAELGLVNSPRVLQEVEGDFSAQVKVCGLIRPTAPPSVPGRVPFQSAGLLLWSDAANYVRLERAALNRGGAIQSSAGFEVRRDGRMAGARSSPLAEQDSYLRLERRGNQLLASASPDGRQWTSLPPLDVALPAKVKVGVTAVNAAQQPLSVRFEEFQIGR